MTDRIPLADLTSDQLDQVYDDLDDLRRQLAESRAAEAILGRRVVGWAELAKSHQHWGQRRWNAWKSARRRAQRLHDELDQLRAGEEDGYIENTEPTPGQWLWKYNRATPERRLQMAAAVIRQAAVVERCELEDHAGAVEDNRQAWRIIGRIRALRDDWLLMTLEPGQVRRLLNGITRALDEPVPEAATQATDPAQLAAAIERVRGYVEHALAADGPGIGLSPGHILSLLDCDPMRTTTQAAGQPEPATITDPEWLKQQYTAALHDADEHSCQEQDGVDYPRLAAAVIRVRDRHLQQLRQRLQLADATLREILTGGQITGDRITRWRATLDELQEQPRV